MIGVVLGLSSALCWGTSDFMGGVQSRRMAAVSVVLWSQLAGGIFLFAVVAATRTTPVPASILWGAAGGIAGAGALVLFYRGLAMGVMSIVAPISACGVVIPVLFALALGHVPTAVAAAGIVAAVAGIILVSLHPGATGDDRRVFRSALLMAIGAACGFGLFFVGVAQGTSVPGGSPLWTTVGARAGSLLILPSLVVLGRASAPWPGRALPLIALIGLLDSGANLQFAIATTRGQLAVVAVLASLYPVATVALGQLVLGERLSRMQGMGVGLALLGVALVSAG